MNPSKKKTAISSFLTSESCCHRLWMRMKKCGSTSSLRLFKMVATTALNAHLLLRIQAGLRLTSGSSTKAWSIFAEPRTATPSTRSRVISICIATTRNIDPKSEGSNGGEEDAVKWAWISIGDHGGVTVICCCGKIWLWVDIYFEKDPSGTGKDGKSVYFRDIWQCNEAVAQADSFHDWAAKVPMLQGVKAVIAKSFERIHDSNLDGIGIIPLCFKSGEDADTLGLTGYESFTFDLRSSISEIRPAQDITVTTDSGKSFTCTLRHGLMSSVNSQSSNCLKDIKADWHSCLDNKVGFKLNGLAVPKEEQNKVAKFSFHGQPAELKHGRTVVIAAITTCTNTSNPNSAPALIANKAIEPLGLEIS